MKISLSTVEVLMCRDKKKTKVTYSANNNQTKRVIFRPIFELKTIFYLNFQNLK